MAQNIQAISDTALRIEWPDDVSLDLNDKIVHFCSKLLKNTIPGVEEWVPAYKSVTIYYLPHIITYRELVNEVQRILEISESTIKHPKKRRIISVPVYYGGDSGPDLKRVATINNIREDEVVKRHQDAEYIVYMLGFLPGFPYLGGLDNAIATPRLEKVRQKTPEGSVGIAFQQTGIYPATSPGGWNIIGKTPLSLINAHKQSAFLFQAGDKVHFYEITYDTFRAIKQEVETSKYNVWKHIREENAHL